MRRDEGFSGLPLMEAVPYGSEAATVASTDPWRARLDLTLGRDARGVSGVREARHEGPLRIQRPFYPEGGDGPCHVYVLHPPGGIVDGDALTLSVGVERDASALVTTPGASKFYRARSRSEQALGPRAKVEQRFRVESGGQLEWFPHETIAFSGSRGELCTEVELAPDATFLGCEVFCLGRPASGEAFAHGELRTTLRLSRAGELSYFERGRFAAGDPVLERPWGLRGLPVFGLLLLASPAVDASWVEAVREGVSCEPEQFAVTLVSGVLLARFLGRTTREARLAMEQAFSILRPYYAGRKLTRPRIWST